MDKMKRCVICEGLLNDSEFKKDSPICIVCVTRLHTEYDLVYSPPERKTKKEALVNLILAIKEQAEYDERKGYASKHDKRLGGPVAAWKHNWLDSPPWSSIWEILKFVDRLNKEAQATISHETRRFS